MPRLRPSDRTDAALVAAFRAGDDAAFTALHDRHRPVLVRYARRVLRHHGHQAEDVVQEAFLRAHRALRRDERPMDLRPWLFRLVRNCSLDELARVRADQVELGSVEHRLVAPARLEPALAFEGRAGLRAVLSDVAALPATQRHALLRRELDGCTHAEVAAELGLSEQATRSLVHRARASLVQTEQDRSADCRGVRDDLDRAHDLRRRASARVYRHLAHCPPCRAHRAALKSQRAALQVLVPGPLLVAAGALFGGKVLAAAQTKATASMATGTLVVAGAAGLGTQLFGPGDPAPVGLQSIALPAGKIDRGHPLPLGTAMVTRVVRLPAGRREHPPLQLRCPPGTRVADLLPGRAPLTMTYAPGTRVGGTQAKVVFEPRTLTTSADVRVGMLCSATTPPRP